MFFKTISHVPIWIPIPRMSEAATDNCFKIDMHSFAIIEASSVKEFMLVDRDILSHRPQPMNLVGLIGALFCRTRS